MSTRFVNWTLGPLWLLLSCFSAHSLAQAPSAEELVRSTTDEVLSLLQAEASGSQPNQAAVNTLVEQKVLPHFDFARMTRLAAGRNWTHLNEAQRTALINEFRALLVRTYSVALTSYQDEVIEYPAVPPSRDANNAIVRTRISQRGSKALAMDYRLALQAGSWKVYDILVDGISLVVNYRSQFNSTIESSGADGLIKMLRDKNNAALANAPL